MSEPLLLPPLTLTHLLTSSSHLSCVQYLQSFIRSAPAGYASFCAERLRRTGLNGVRGEPPSWLELQVPQVSKGNCGNI